MDLPWMSQVLRLFLQWIYHRYQSCLTDRISTLPKILSDEPENEVSYRFKNIPEEEVDCQIDHHADTGCNDG